MSLPDSFNRPLDSLKPLPDKLKKSLEEIRSLDVKAMKQLSLVDNLCQNYLENMDSFSRHEKTKRLNEIEEIFERVNLYSQDKIDIAEDTYETVDKFIQQLDEDLSQLRPGVKEEYQNLDLQDKEKEDVPKKRKKSKSKDENALLSTKKTSLPQSAKKNKVELEESAKDFQLGVSNMPVDPNEPVFCTCQQVSYGSMIKCDNNDCVFEWFHFPCVGIKVIPKGKWYCPKCKPPSKK